MICTALSHPELATPEGQGRCQSTKTSKPTDPVMPDVRTLYRSVLSGPIIPEVHASKDGNSR
jgi:hypothetical protein